MLYNHKLVNLLFEGVSIQLSDDTNILFENIPVDTLGQVHAIDYELEWGLNWTNQDSFVNWGTFNPDCRHRFWDDGTGRSNERRVIDLLTSIDEWFSENPTAKEDCKKLLQLPIPKKGKIMESAKPLWPDSAVDKEVSDKNVPPLWIIKGIIRPHGYMKYQKAWKAWVIDRGNNAEAAFAKFLKTQGFSDAKTIGGSANPDVLANGMKFEVGTGNDKRLHLGVPARTSDVPHIQHRIKTLDAKFPNKSYPQFLSSRDIYDMWINSGYDFLVRGTDIENFKIYALKSNLTKVGNMNIQLLEPQDCDSSTLHQDRSSIYIKYGSINWNRGTRTK